MACLDTKIPEPCGSHHGALDSREPPASPTSTASDAFSETPAAFRPDIHGSSPQPLTFRADDELWVLLQALPTKANIEALIGRLKDAHRQELQALKSDMQSLSDRLSSGETTGYGAGIFARIACGHGDDSATTLGGLGRPGQPQQSAAPGSP